MVRKPRIHYPGAVSHPYLIQGLLDLGLDNLPALRSIKQESRQSLGAPIRQ